jgi:1-phosphofructokinase family hexose kinase
MIYTVTLNPTLDITYILDEITFEKPVRASQVLKNPGGKGINVSIALNSMGIHSVAIGLIGGFTGEEIHALLKDEGLDLRFIEIENETRTNVDILGEKDGNELAIRSAGPAVKEEKTELITRFILDIAQPPGILVLSGSLPPGMRDDIYASLIAYGKSQGMKAILDSHDEPLRLGIDAGPYLIKPNLEELRRLAGREFAKTDAIIEYCRGLIEKGIEIVVISLGGSGALIMTDKEAWIGMVPCIEGEHTIGAGDSMVAGLIKGIIEDKPLEELFKIGLACGLSAVLNEGPGLCEPETFNEALSQIKMERIL